jgi:hypothetical protein
MKYQTLALTLYINRDIFALRYFEFVTMKRLLSAFFTGICIACLAGCTPLFNADFEEDVPFQEPDLTPPGAPAGDEIVLQGADNAVYEVTPNGLDGNGSLRMEAAPNSDARVRMVANGIGNPETAIVMTYNGRLIERSHAEVNIGTGGSQWAVQITLINGSIIVNGMPTGSYVEGGEHTMVLSLFPNTDTFTLGFTGAVLFGDPIAGPLGDPSAFPGSVYELVFELLPTQEGGIFILDNVLIGSRNS